MLPLIKPKSVLALTATAGPTVVRDICHTLCIPFDDHGIDTGDCLPSPSENSGVKVLSCDRDNIDVFSIILQSNDERRYLVNDFIFSPVYAPYLPHPLILLVLFHSYTKY